jgi:hypothetical protein
MGNKKLAGKFIIIPFEADPPRWGIHFDVSKGHTGLPPGIYLAGLERKSDYDKRLETAKSGLILPDHFTAKI